MILKLNGMQERNFEKQVKHKMDELSLTPSEPVWKKIEEQVRKKRDRRRLFFWLPVTILLCSGALWLIEESINNSNPIATAKQEINKTNGI